MLRRSTSRPLGFLVFLDCLLALWILRDVANVTSTRLYLSDRADTLSVSDASERFEVEQSRVVPQIATRRDEAILFPTDFPWPSTLQVEARPASRVDYEIRWRGAGIDRVLAQGRVAAPTRIAATIPAGHGVMALVGRAPLTWADPRIVSRLRIARRALAFVLVTALAVVMARRQEQGNGVRHLFAAIAIAIGVAIAATTLEVGLRALGDRAPAAILAQRHDLGEVRKDTRWEMTRRYGRRLRAHVDDTSEWRYGDIVRMGFIPAGVTDGVLRRFPFQTDAEGFRNARTRNRIDVAAIGDSFTDAMTIEESASWPRLLERTSGLAVQNYGTAAFGPQQEFRVLTDFALAHRPKIVVLAYFAGNDIFDAEAFDASERSHGAIQRSGPGWPINRIVSRADTLYVTSALHAARGWLAKHGRAEARAADPSETPVTTAAPAPPFDRGMYTVAVGGQTLRTAFMPPYLNTLRMAEAELSARQGWAITTETIRGMRDASREAGAQLVVLFLPFKSQLFLPIVASAMSRDELSRALRYALPDGTIDIDAMMRNRLAQNRMMRRFCADEHIPLLDTTDALAERILSGVNPYFPDDSHLNEAGHGVVAAALDAFFTAPDAGRCSGTSAPACLRRFR